MDDGQEYPHALPAGYRIQDYEITGVLGQGSFGITYLAYDNRLDCPVAIKEYLPCDWAVRHDGSTVLPRSPDDKERFKWGLDQFIEEARTLERFRYDTIIRIRHCVVENETAYLVMDYAEGETLADFLKREGPVDEETLMGILLPILDGLEKVHETGFLHRDIKPGNIIIRKDGLPVLIDFGAARQAMGQGNRPLTAILTPGYAPIEQYGDDAGEQGPWTDIYALGAVAYQALTGEMPREAAQRVRNRTHSPLTETGMGRASHRVRAAIDTALAVNEADRPQTIGEWRDRLLADGEERAADHDPATILSPATGTMDAATIMLPADDARKTGTVQTVAPKSAPKSSAKGWRYAAAAALVLTVLGAGVALTQFAGTETAPEISAEPAAFVSVPEPDGFTVAADGSGDFKTIAKALANAPQGSTIRIKSGTYRENLVLNRTLHLEGTGDRADVVIISDKSDVLKIESGSGSLKNLTLRYDGENSDHATIWITGGTFLIENCDVSNKASVGVFVDGGAPVLKNNDIHNTWYNGISIQGTAGGTYTGNHIFDAGFKNPEPNSNMPDHPAVFLSPQSTAQFLDDNRIDGGGFPVIYPPRDESNQ